MRISDWSSDVCSSDLRTGLPSIIRPSFTMGGTGGGIAYNREEFEHIVRGGLIASPTTEVLIEESLLGWKEYEMEVVRDSSEERRVGKEGCQYVSISVGAVSLKNK